MSLLRFVSLVILAIWVGGLAVLGFITAPSAFDVLDRDTAAKVFGEVFTRFQRLTWVLGALLASILATRAALGPRPRRFWVRLWTTIGMLAISLVSALLLTPRITAIRQSTSGAIATLDANDPRKLEFNRLHGLSNALMIVTLIAGVGLIWYEAEDRH